MKGPRFELQSMLISPPSTVWRFCRQFLICAGLAVLSDFSVDREGAYYFAYPVEKATFEPLSAFRSWLQAEAFRATAADSSRNAGCKSCSGAAL